MMRAIAHARRLHGTDRVEVLAWTTAAAKFIDGSTLHKFLHVGIAELQKERTLAAVKGNIFVRRKLSNMAAVFIDGLLLIATRLLIILEYVVWQLAPAGRHGRPWGGCQVVGTFRMLVQG